MTLTDLFNYLKAELPGMTISVRQEIWHHEFRSSGVQQMPPTDMTIYRVWVDDWGKGFSDFDDPEKALRQVLLYREEREEEDLKKNAAALDENRERPMVRILRQALDACETRGSGFINGKEVTDA